MASAPVITGAPARAPTNLLPAIRIWCRSHGMSETRFGRAALGDPRLISDIRRGRTLRPRTLSRVLVFMGVC